MGQTCGRTSDPISVKSKEIDLELRKLKQKKDTKILLLGPGESGKSTIFKQMKIVQQNGGFTEEERLRFRSIVYSNCLSQMSILAEVALKESLEFGSADNEKAAMALCDLNTEQLWTPEIGLMIKSLWSDPAIQQVYSMRDQRRFQLNDTAGYFFNSMDRILAEKYIPSIDDVLRVRVRSTGIEEAEFKFDKMNIKVVDVGGQRSERRKWIHCFAQVTSVLFCASLSDYCLSLRENSNINRMDEALELFSEVSNSPYFINSSIILFLNKVDLFEEKLKLNPLNLFFTNFEGGDHKVACEFVKARFMELVADSKRLYPHITCALDTNQIEHVIFDVRAKILKEIIFDDNILN